MRSGLPSDRFTVSRMLMRTLADGRRTWDLVPSPVAEVAVVPLCKLGVPPVIHFLVGGFNLPPEKYEVVSWDDNSQYVEKHVPKHQHILIGV